VASKSSRRKQERKSYDSAKSERARIVAAFVGLLVEQSIKKISTGQVAAVADVSLAQLREEFGSTIAVLAVHVEQIDRLVLSGENVEIVESVQGFAMLLTWVLRNWLDGKDPDLARAMSALDRAGAWPQSASARDFKCVAPSELSAGAPRGLGR
jgi:AcrR family transcriptional regulator